MSEILGQKPIEYLPKRHCNKCRIISEDLELFVKDSGSKYGRRNLCKECANKNNREDSKSTKYKHKHQLAKRYGINLIEQDVLAWSSSRKILQNSTPQQQFLKLVSEVGELADNLAKGKDVRDDIGDCLVVLTNIAYMVDSNLEDCFQIAYDDIKHRKGFLNEHGVFVKDTDEAYQHQVEMEV